MKRISTRMLCYAGAVLFAMVAAACPFRSVGDGILHCYLTWQGDTSTTMTINYHAAPGGAQSAVYYDKVSRGGDPDAYVLQALGGAFEIPGLNAFAGAKRDVHAVKLTNLEPGQTYYFVAGDASTGFTQEKMFRTLPASGAVNFVTGGDMGTDNVVRSLLSQAALQSPYFGLIGGDVAYANGRTTSWREWEKWLDNWESQMVTPGGYTIPMVLAIGNHETNGGYGQFANPTNAAPFYFGYFAQEGTGFTQARSAYFDRWFGDKIRLFVLDSGHVTAIDGAQKTWLETELAATPAGVLTFALYHVPMYPSERNFEDSAALRAAWRPAFDTYGLTAAFENHDHVQKRTKRLVNDTPNVNGTLYIGDGCFGRSPRPGRQAMDLETSAELVALGLTENYLAAWDSRRHFWTVDVAADASTVDFNAIDGNGVVFDSYTLVP